MRWTVVGAALLGLFSGCGSSFHPPETFEWGTRPITFSPPPADWERTGELSGGLKGARFVRRWEAMGVAEYYLVGDRDRRPALKDLLDRFDSFDERELRRQLQLALYRTDDPLSPDEAEVAAEANEAIHRATMAHINGDLAGARSELAAALAAAERLKLALDDVVGRVEFRPERRQEPERYRLLSRRSTEIAGRSASVVDFTLWTPERPYWGREVYVMDDNHLFVATYQGSKSNLSLFDRMVATISFPTADSLRASK